MFLLIAGICSYVLKIITLAKTLQMKHLFLLLLLLCTGTIWAQNIAGHVYSAADGRPLEGASVYLDGTTLSTTTDADGYFKVTSTQQYSAGLVVSFIGFQTQRIADPYKNGQPLIINLVPEILNLKEVVVSKNKPLFSRQQMLNAFKEQFLGTSDAARSCTILNENDIYLTYDEQTFTLNAEAEKPILVRNTTLQYDISYDLKSFRVKFRAKSIDKIDALTCNISGYTLFRDRSKNGNANRLRQEAYYGSVPHLMKTLSNNSWDKGGFYMYKLHSKFRPQDLLQVTDSAGVKKVKVLPEAKQIQKAYNRQFKSDEEVTFNVSDRRNRTSFIIFNQDEFYIDKNGMVFPLEALMFGGYLGSLKTGDMLPADYVYVGN